MFINSLRSCKKVFLKTFIVLETRSYCIAFKDHPIDIYMNDYPYGYACKYVLQKRKRST